MQQSGMNVSHERLVVESCSLAAIATGCFRRHECCDMNAAQTAARVLLSKFSGVSALEYECSGMSAARYWHGSVDAAT